MGKRQGKTAYRTPSSFKHNVRKVVAGIPKGKVMTYGEVAKKAGNAKAARGVGSIMHVNPTPETVPCHRVVASDGTLGGYAHGVEAKAKILKKEGVKITRKGESYRWQ